MYASVAPRQTTHHIIFSLMINIFHAFPRALRTHPLTSYILVDSFILPKPPDGLEPPYNDYKSLVLPLHQGSIYNFLISYINIISKNFLKIKLCTVIQNSTQLFKKI